MSWHVWLIVIVAVVGLIWLLKRPIYYRHVSSSEIRTHLKDFIKQFGSGSLLFIHHEGSKKMIQFAIYGEADDAVLHFAYPDANWSRDYFDKIANSLREVNMGFRLTDTEEKYVPRFLEIDWKLEDDAVIESAMETAEVAFKVMGIEQGSFGIHYSGRPSKASVEDTISKADNDSRLKSGIGKRLIDYMKNNLDNEYKKKL